MKLLGETNLKVKIGTQFLFQNFQICPEMKQPLILGTDFLYQNDVRIWLSRNQITVNNENIMLTDYETIVSLVRLTEDIEIPAQHVVSTFGKYNKNKYMPKDGNFVLQLTHVNTGFLEQEPGLAVCNSIANISSNRRVALTFVNMTQKYFCLKKGNVVAKLDVIPEASVSSINVDPQGHETYPSGASLQSADICMGCQLTPNQERQLRDLLDRNKDIFAKHAYDVGRTKLLKAHIDTGDHPPIRRQPYRAPFSKHQEIKSQIDEMLKAKIISPSVSPWSFPIICVPKKTGDVRLCIDLRPLNAITKKFHFPLPQLDEILTKLSGAKYFTSLDMIKSYFHIELDKQSRQKVAFTTEYGLFEYNCLPFGWTNSPGFFSKLTWTIFKDAPNVLNYMDDVVCFSDTFSNHLVHLQDCLDRLKNAGLKLRLSKCQFVKTEIQYLGHMISAKGVKPDMRKVEAIKQIPTPTTVREVRQFLGCTSYYRKFIPNYSKIAEPLTALTRKYVKFEWNTDRQQAFDFLKKSLQEPPILALPNMKNPNFELYCDASDTAIGSVLCQKEDSIDKPIYYFSHKLSKSQQKWSIIEKETYSLVLSVQFFRPYLYGQSFTIYSDHAPLKFINSAQMKNSRVQRWATIISESGANVKYITGKANSRADFLSRLRTCPVPGKDIKTIEAKLNANVINTDQLPKHKQSKPSADSVHEWEYDFRPSLPFPDIDLEQAQKHDPVLSDIIQQLVNGDSQEIKKSSHIMLDDGILYYIDRDESLLLEIPQTFQQQLIEEIHSGFCGAHCGRDRTFNKMRARYHWPGMTKDIYQFLSKCIPCNTANLQQIEPPLQESTMPQFPFETIAIDTCGPYPRAESGNSYIITVVDLFTGYIETIPVVDKTSTTVAKVLMEHIIPRHGTPRSLVTDNGLEYCNEIVNKLSETFKIHRIRTSIYTPQANGKVERTHRLLVSFLSKLKPQEKLKWDVFLPSFCAAHNSSKSQSSGFSPFFLLYGRDMLLPVDTLLAHRTKYLGEDYFPQSLERMHTTFRLVRRHIKEQTNRNKKYHDKKANVKEIKFKVGEAVYFKNYERQTKLDSKWVPYYRIIKQRSPSSFVIKDQISGAIKNVHAKDLRHATDSELWDKTIPVPDNVRKTRLVVPPSSEEDPSSQSSSEQSDLTDDNQGHRLPVSGGEQVNITPVRIPQSVTDDVRAEVYDKTDETDLVDDTVSSKPEPVQADRNNKNGEKDKKNQLDLHEEMEVRSEDDTHDLSDMGVTDTDEENQLKQKDEDKCSPSSSVKQANAYKNIPKRKLSVSPQPSESSSDFSSDDELPLATLRDKIRKPAKRQRQAAADANLKMKLLKDVICILSDMK
jgi:hypothetical protein